MTEDPQNDNIVHSGAGVVGHAVIALAAARNRGHRAPPTQVFAPDDRASRRDDWLDLGLALYTPAWYAVQTEQTT